MRTFSPLTALSTRRGPIHQDKPAGNYVAAVIFAGALAWWALTSHYYDLLALLKSLDLMLFHAINGLCGRSPIFDRIVDHLDDDQLKGVLFAGTFGACWFQRAKSQTQRRETLILLLLAIVISVILARGFAHVLPFRQRPMFTADIGYRLPLFPTTSYFEDWSSFPSTHAAVLFAMTAGFWLLSRGWGLMWLGFSIIAMTARVYLGVHYPADVIFGALIGISITIALNSQVMRTRVAARILSLEQVAPSILYGLLFPFVGEVASFFGFTRGLLHAIVHLIHGV